LSGSVSEGITTVDVEIRTATAADAEQCGRVCFAAFTWISELRRFPADFPTVDYAKAVIAHLIASPSVYGVVAESDGRIVGSNFIDERDAVRGVGPVSVDPDFHGRGVGKLLMKAVLERDANAGSVRLLQDAHNPTSLSLYASLGFDLKEPIALVTGRPASWPSGALEVRPLEPRDLAPCASLCREIHGFDRTNSLREAGAFEPRVGLREGRITAYASSLTAWPVAHGVAQSEHDMTQLVLAAGVESETVSFLVPMRTPLFRWSLHEGLRTVKTMNLMSIGRYQEPTGCWFPSVIY
jgi:predicted N-acetyltransferase YhbS